MDEEKRETLAALSKLMAVTCVRNTKLEDIHAGIVPVSRTGDYSDVVVVGADGNRIPWPRVSHFDDDAMRDLMRQVVNRLYTFHVHSLRRSGFSGHAGVVAARHPEMGRAEAGCRLDGVRITAAVSRRPP